MVYNRKLTRKQLARDKNASPTVWFEATFLTAIIDIKEKRDIMTNNIPNAFIQALILQNKQRKECIIMKITEVLVDLLVEMAPKVYRPYMVKKNKAKTLHVEVMKALYGMLKATLLWYKKFKSNLENIIFKFNFC